MRKERFGTLTEKDKKEKRKERFGVAPVAGGQGTGKFGVCFVFVFVFLYIII